MHGVGKTYTPKVVMPDQRSLYDQLIDLHAMATRAKMYDAADYLATRLATQLAGFPKAIIIHQEAVAGTTLMCGKPARGENRQIWGKGQPLVSVTCPECLAAQAIP